MFKGPLPITPPDRGVLFVLTGPSGVGKSTLIQRAMAVVPGLCFSVSATTRSPRPGEQDGREYHFLGAAEFAEKVSQGEFLEHAEVYDRRYGTLRAPTNEVLASGRSILLDIDVQGAEQVRANSPDAVFLFIAPPKVQTLEERLRARGTESDAAIRRRMEQVAQQLAGLPDYDYVVVNDDLDAAEATLVSVLVAEMARVSRRGSVLRALLG